MKGAVCAALILIVNGSPDRVWAPELIPEALDTEKIYVIFRGTQSKEGRIVTKFNIADGAATHVGILYASGGSWCVAHIDNSSLAKGFAVQPIDKFLSPVHKIYSSAIWEISSADCCMRERFERFVDSVGKKPIRFDLAFSREEDDRMYCSEFVVQALDHSGFGKCIPLHKKALNGIERAYFRTDTLHYYPVDAFQFMPGIDKIAAIK